MKLLNFILLTILSTSLSFAQCELLDLDNDGFVGANSLVQHLANYATDNLESDLNEDGVVGVEDIFTLMPYIGQPCSSIDGWLPETNDHVLGVVLEEYFVHETEIVASIPAGSTTYRVYVELSDPTDQLIGVYGTSSNPLSISTDTEFYFLSFMQSFPCTSSDVNPLMLPVFPDAEYATFVGVNSILGNTDVNVGLLTDGTSNDEYWMGGPSQFEINSDVGGGWFNINVIYPENNSSDNLQLIGQFTVLNTSEFSGTINVHARTTEVELHDHIEVATGLTFSSDDISTWGCTDPTAFNYDQEADFSDGSCIDLADFDGDGTVTVQDLLLLIENMGCTNCPDFDLNGDGIVNVFDLLDFLQQF